MIQVRGRVFAVLQILVLKEAIATLIVALIEEDFSKAGVGTKVFYRLISL